MVKYSLSPSEFPRAEPKGTPQGSGSISQYWLPQEGNTDRVDSPYRSRSLGYTFRYCPVGKAIRVHIGPVENPAAEGLKNTFSQESNTKRVNFPCSNF